MVTFETPLMFSRSSSIASLGSCEPQEGFIGSSAVSECRLMQMILVKIIISILLTFIIISSRATSGLVTPSEIPDSPTPTVPPSPQCFRSNLVFIMIFFWLKINCNILEVF